MARPRINIANSVALGALVWGAPLAAQATSNGAASQAATPTPAPAPGGTAVGPPQLRDFNLNGTVTQPAQPAPPAAAAPPRASPPASGSDSTAKPAPAKPERGSAALPVVKAPKAVAAERAPSPAADAFPGAANDELPPATTAPLTAEPSFAPPPPAATPTPPAAMDAATNLWTWLAAGLAVLLGGAFLWWRRRQDGARTYAADQADLGTLVAARDTPPTPMPPVPRPPSPVSRQPGPATAAPRPSVAPAQPATAPVPPPPVAGGIVASGLKPRVEFELVPVRAEVDEAQGAALTVDILVINRGSAPARDVLVDTLLINAGPQVDAEVGRFFLQGAQGGERIALIGPMARTTIRVRLALPASGIAPLLVGGRKLLVPLVAINARYRWSGGELADSASFIVGRGDQETEKLAPFRLDTGARHWSGLSARLHSNGLQA